MDSNETPFNLMIFTDSTKKVCMCSAISIFIIILFVISPLSNFLKISTLMKLIALIMLFFTIYLNNYQTTLLRKAFQNINISEQVKTQLNVNILCSFIFTTFIGLLIIFVFKSFF
jgi:hypothetical protein